jgi:hypothetical protein
LGRKAFNLIWKVPYFLSGDMLPQKTSFWDNMTFQHQYGAGLLVMGHEVALRLWASSEVDQEYPLWWCIRKTIVWLMKKQS